MNTPLGIILFLFFPVPLNIVTFLSQGERSVFPFRAGQSGCVGTYSEWSWVFSLCLFGACLMDRRRMWLQNWPLGSPGMGTCLEVSDGPTPWTQRSGHLENSWGWVLGVFLAVGNLVCAGGRWLFYYWDRLWWSIFQCSLQKAPFWFLLMVSRKNPWLVLAEHLLYARLCVKCMACTNSFNPHDDLGVGSEVLMMSYETLGYHSLPVWYLCSLAHSASAPPASLCSSNMPGIILPQGLCTGCAFFLVCLSSTRRKARDLPPLPSDLCSNVVIPEKGSYWKFHLFLTHW